MDVELTDSVRRVVDLAVRGLSNAEIAGLIGVAEDTVKRHMTAAFRAYGVNNRVKLALAYHGIDTVQPDGPPRGWELVALVARSGDAHWVGPAGDGSRRLCVHTAAGPLGWDVPKSAVRLMPPMPMSGVDHSPGEDVTYGRLGDLPVRRPAAARSRRVS